MYGINISLKCSGINGLTQNFTYQLQSTCVMKNFPCLRLLFWFVKIECPANVQAGAVITVLSLVHTVSVFGASNAQARRLYLGTTCGKRGGPRKARIEP